MQVCVLTSYRIIMLNTVVLLILLVMDDTMFILKLLLLDHEEWIFVVDIFKCV